MSCAAPNPFEALDRVAAGDEWGVPERLIELVVSEALEREVLDQASKAGLPER